jgi:hypothetical protein
VSDEYLGIDTVVDLSHPEFGVDLADLAQPGEPTGDAGDQSTGLDRFGRVGDRRSLKTSTGGATDSSSFGDGVAVAVS